MRENSARGPTPCLSCVLVPLFALGLCLPWKNNSDSAERIPDTNDQTRPLGAAPSGATTDSGLPAGDADSMISPSEIIAAADSHLKNQQQLSAASSEIGNGPASAGTPSGFYATSIASNISSDIPPLGSLRPGVQASHERKREQDEIPLASIQERGEKLITIPGESNQYH